MKEKRLGKKSRLSGRSEEVKKEERRGRRVRERS